MSLDLTPIEARVLASLVEKERATPQNYPLTLNALRSACNQTTNRAPVTTYDELELQRTVDALKERSLLRFVYSTSNRATKFRHVLDEALGIDDAELALLCVLLLRGPQTVGELKGRTERLFTFDDLGAVQEVLDQLAGREPEPLVERLPRQPGQKDARYVHLLGDRTDEAPVVASAPDQTPIDTPRSDTTPPLRSTGEPRAPEEIESLRTEIEELRAALDELRGEFERFRAEFG